MRYVDRDASARRRALLLEPARPQDSDQPRCRSIIELFQSGFRGDNHKPFPISWLAPTFDSVWNNLRSCASSTSASTGDRLVDGPPVVPARTFDINEKILRRLRPAQLSTSTGGDDRSTARSACARSRPKTRSAASCPAATAAVAGRRRATNYTDWLPNVNMSIHFTPQAAAAPGRRRKTRTRPTFEQLNPALALGSAADCAGRREPSCFRTGTRRQSLPRAAEVEQLRRQPRILFLADRLCLRRRVPPRHEGLHRQPHVQFPCPIRRPGCRC